MHRLRPETLRCCHDVDRRVPRTDARDAASYMHIGEGTQLRCFNELHRAANAGQILAGDCKIPRFSEPHANKYRIVFFFKLRERNVSTDIDVLAEFDAESANRLHFAQRIARAQFVRSDSVRVQASGHFVAIENRHTITHLSQFRSTSQRRRPGTDTGDAFAVRRTCMEKLDPAIENVIHCVPLQPANLDWLLSLLVHHASAFAKHFRRADAAATRAQNVGL